MKINSIQISLSYFGLFEISSNDIRTKISEKFKDEYKLISQNRPIGQQIQPIIIAEKPHNNVRIIFSNNRIDLFYIFNENDSFNESIKKILFKEQQKIIDVFGQDFNRIALNCFDFIYDESELFLEKFVNNSPLSNEFGKSLEFELKYNNVFTFSNVDFNSIISIKSGKASKNDSLIEEEKKALIFMSDINSVVNAFKISESVTIEEFFNKLIDNYQDKLAKIIAFLEK